MEIHRVRYTDYTPATVTALAFSHTEAHSRQLRLAVGRGNGDIELWTPRHQWVCELVLSGGRGRSAEAVVWALGRLFLAGGSTVVTEWDLALGVPAQHVDCNAAVVWLLAANEDGTKLAAGCDDGLVVVFDVASGLFEYSGVLPKCGARVLSLVWYGEYVVGGCSDGRIRMWLAAQKLIVQTFRVDKLRTESTLVWSVAVCGSELVLGDSTGCVKFWDLEKRALVQLLSVHAADVLTLTVANNTVFSAGVDRKIQVFMKPQGRWTNTGNRLVHALDVRAVAAHGGAGLLVSGGAERTLVVSSVKGFVDGPFRKLAVTPQCPPYGVCSLRRVVYQWQDTEVKVWTLAGRLLAHLALAGEDNIASVAMSEDGGLMAVASLLTTRLFKLNHGKTFKVQKVREALGETLGGLGARLLQFAGSQLVGVSADNEVWRVELDKALVEHLDTLSPEVALPHLATITSLAVGKHVAITRASGGVEVCGSSPRQLARLSAPCRACTHTATGTLLVLTAENRLYEFDVEAEQPLTEWLRNNTEAVASQLASLADQPMGMFVDLLAPSRVWLYGALWMAYVDRSVAIPPTNTRGAKRSQAGLYVDTDDGLENDDALELPGVETKSMNSLEAVWVSRRYHPVAYVAEVCSGELVVVERPVFTTGGFKVKQLGV